MIRKGLLLSLTIILLAVNLVIVVPTVSGVIKNSLIIRVALDSAGNSAGTTNPAPGWYEYSPPYPTVDVSPSPNAGYKLHYWDLDGYNVGYQDPIHVDMSANHSLTAIFEPRLEIVTTPGGTTTPAPGWYYYTNGTNVSVTAKPDPGNTFDHWELDGANVGSTNPYTVTIAKKYQNLTAVFYYWIKFAAHCYISDSALSLPIYRDGSPTGYNTPHNFTSEQGPHEWSVPSTDAHGHPFLRWSNGFTGVSLYNPTTAKTYTAYYWAAGGNPQIFVAKAIGDYFPPTGGIVTMKVNVSSTPSKGLWSYEFSLTLNKTVFPPVLPVGNMNFSDTTKWSTTTEVTSGTASYGYDSGTGNLGAPSYFQRATSTAGSTADIMFYTGQTFNWPLGTPPGGGAEFSFAYRISGTSIGGYFMVARVIKPNLDFELLTDFIEVSAPTGWTYATLSVTPTAFDQVGTYTIELVSWLATLDTGTTKYVQVNWDDIGLKLAPVSVTQHTTLRTGGPTFFMSRYEKSGVGSLYVAESIMGTGGVDAWAVPGNYTLVIIKLIVGYGCTKLDLYSTDLTTLDLSGNPVSYSHAAVDGWFSNRLYGDVDSDRDVDASDLFALGKAYGTDPLKPGWNYKCDFNWDGKIDTSDLSDLGKNYGKKV